MTPDRPGFRSDIEGLRGLAILLVVAFHAGVSRLAGGFVGVDVFFVLSGFFITLSLAREVERRGDVDLSAFYTKRAQRLLPAFLVVFFATLGAVLWLYAPIDQPSIASDARWIAVHAGNVLFAQSALDYHASDRNPLLHTWSLAVEQQFYLVWPLLFALIGRRYGVAKVTRPRMLVWVAVAGVLSFALSLWATTAAQPWAFFGMPTRIWEFALGGAVALGADSTAASSNARGALIQAAGLIAIAIGVVTYHGATPYPGAAAILPALGAVALLIGGMLAPDNVVRRAMGNGMLRWFGRYSYSWYLWHWPLVGVGAALDWRIGVAGKLAWSAFALLLAVLTTEYVEEPVRRGEITWLENHRVPLAAAIASIAAVLVAHASMLAARQRVASPAQRTFAQARADNMEHDCWGTLLDNPSAPCVFGDMNARTSVMLLGDSHAEHWLPALDRIGRERGWRVTAMIKPACPVADLKVFISRRLKRHYAECGEFRAAMLRRILRERPALVILSSYDHYVDREDTESSWGVSPAAWRDALRRTYTLLSEAGLRTVVIRDVPDAGFDAPACLSRRAAGMPFARPCEYDLGEALHPRAVAAQSAAARGLARLAFVDMTDRVCSSRPCPVVQRGDIVFRDGDHLTARFSRAEAPVLGARIASAVSGMR
jgi:peptidoglycan/LPS O-acetylase OafA/YrhL